MKKGEYMKLIDCTKPEEVLEKVKKFSSSLSNDEHKIRSIILDIHATVEMKMRQTLYHHMLSIAFKDANGKIDEKVKEDIADTISKMSFDRLHKLLKPCFKSFPHPDLQHIKEINKVRNKTAHYFYSIWLCLTYLNRTLIFEKYLLEEDKNKLIHEIDCFFMDFGEGRRDFGIKIIDKNYLDQLDQIYKKISSIDIFNNDVDRVCRLRNNLKYLHGKSKFLMVFTKS